MKEIKDNEQTFTAPKTDGLTVPEGYFEQFAAQMSGKLPFREELDVPVAQLEEARPNRTWLRVRPYVYMAAMFAGAWCLLKMFSLMTADRNDVSLSNFPELSKAMDNREFVEMNVIRDLNAYDIYETLLEEGNDPVDLTLFEENEQIYAQQESSEVNYKLPTATVASPDNANDNV